MGQITITVNDWVLKDIIGTPKNKSARTEELIIKGFLAEKEKELKCGLWDYGIYWLMLAKAKFYLIKARM